MATSTASPIPNIPTTPFSPYTPLEVLLLFHNLSIFGTHPGIFSLISNILNKNPLVQEHESFDRRRLSPDALREFFQNLLQLAEESAKANRVSANGNNGGGSAIFDIAKFTADMKERFFGEYKNTMIRLIRADEDKYLRLEAEIKEIEEGRREQKMVVNATGGLQASEWRTPKPNPPALPPTHISSFPKREASEDLNTVIKTEHSLPSAPAQLPPIQVPQSPLQVSPLAIQPVPAATSAQHQPPSTATSPTRQHVQPSNVQPIASPTSRPIHPVQRPQPPPLQASPILPPLPPLHNPSPMHSPPLHSPQHMVQPSNPVRHYSPPMFPPIAVGHPVTPPKTGQYGPISPPQFGHPQQPAPVQQASQIDQQRPMLPNLHSSPIGQSPLSAYRMQSPGHQQGNFNQIILPIPNTHPHRIPLNLPHPPQSHQIPPISQSPAAHPIFSGQLTSQQLISPRPLHPSVNQTVAVQNLQQMQLTQALPPKTAQVQHTTQPLPNPPDTARQQPPHTTQPLPTPPDTARQQLPPLSSMIPPIQEAPKPQPPPAGTTPLSAQIIATLVQSIRTPPQYSEERFKTLERPRTPERPGPEDISPISTPSRTPEPPDFNEVFPEQLRGKKRSLEETKAPISGKSEQVPARKPRKFKDEQDISPKPPEPKRRKSMTTLDSIPMPLVTSAALERTKTPMVITEKNPTPRATSAKTGTTIRGPRNIIHTMRGKSVESEVAIEAQEDAMAGDTVPSPPQAGEKDSVATPITQGRSTIRRASMRKSPVASAMLQPISRQDEDTKEEALSLSPRDAEMAEAEEQEPVTSETEDFKEEPVEVTPTPKAAAAARARLAKQTKRKRATSHAPRADEPETPIPASPPTFNSPRMTLKQASPTIELPPPSALLEESESTSSLSSASFPPPTPSPITAPAIASSSAPVLGHQAKVVATKKFTQLTNPILTDISGHRFANIFSTPVNEKVAPGYNKMIYRPMDLKTIKTAIKNGVTAVNSAMAAVQSQSSEPATPASTSFPSSSTFPQTPSTCMPATSGDRILPSTTNIIPPKGIINTAQLEKELFRMLANAIMYNKSNTEIARETAEMAKEVDIKIANFRNAERAGEERGKMRGDTPFATAFNTPAGSVKGLRGKPGLTPVVAVSKEHLSMLNSSTFLESPMPREKGDIEGAQQGQNTTENTEGDDSKGEGKVASTENENTETNKSSEKNNPLKRRQAEDQEEEEEEEEEKEKEEKEQEEMIPDSQPSPPKNTNKDGSIEDKDEEMEDGDETTSPAATATAETPASTANIEGDDDAEEIPTPVRGVKKRPKKKKSSRR